MQRYRPSFRAHTGALVCICVSRLRLSSTLLEWKMQNCRIRILMEYIYIIELKKTQAELARAISSTKSRRKPKKNDRDLNGCPCDRCRFSKLQSIPVARNIQILIAIVEKCESRANQKKKIHTHTYGERDWTFQSASIPFKFILNRSLNWLISRKVESGNKRMPSNERLCAACPVFHVFAIDPLSLSLSREFWLVSVKHIRDSFVVNADQQRHGWIFSSYTHNFSSSWIRRHRHRSSIVATFIYTILNNIMCVRALHFLSVCLCMSDFCFDSLFVDFFLYFFYLVAVMSWYT